MSSVDRFGITQQKLVYHPQRTAAWLDARGNWEKTKQIFPIYVEISPVGACNQRCRFCDSDYVGYKSIRLDAMLLKTRIAEMGKLGVKSIMFAGEGEPLLHRKIVDLTKAAHDAGIDVSFTSNATVMDEAFIEGALPLTSWFKASINAGTPGTYSKIHKSKPQEFNTVVANLKQAVEFRNRNNLQLTLGAQAVLLPDNAKEMERLAFICRDEIGLDYLIIKPYTLNKLSGNTEFVDIDYLPLLSLERKLAVLNNADFQISFRGAQMRNSTQKDYRNYQRCYATPFFWSYVMADGSVYGCGNYLMDDRFKYGNLNYHGFAQIWQSERRARAIEFMNSEFDIAKCRPFCRMDEVNEYLEGVINSQVPHVNFI